ncbi:hypothetical protein [Microbacterium galbinum]|uniref:Transmembrane protein n=1 Tax=Microbacterium galbinum TaxID=2851646 RepID=A0ABY4ISQ1_9MICO|nr:hypothetical protein [Microbacterium galbinum]UPL14353.1 hypothetical protein KV396_07650 [Microbacterium galbinum]
MTMFGRWRKRSEDEKTSQASTVQRPSAAEIDAEYGDYTARIRKSLVFGAILGVFGAGAFGFVAWTTQTSSASERSGATDVGPTVILAALPASIMLAGFSILAALAIALQLAVRTPSVTETRPATAVARRRFLCSIANLVVPSSVALAAYSTPAALAGAPETLDLVRVFGPWLCAAFVAVIAADAGVASDPEYDRAEMGRLYRARVARRVLVGLRMVGERRDEVTSRSIAWQSFVLAGAPAATAIVSFASAPELLPRQAVALVILALVVAGVVYAVATRVYVNIIARDWITVSGIITGTILVGAIGWLMLIGISARWMVAEHSLVPATTTVAWAVVYVAVPAIVAAWSLIPFSDGRPRLLGLVVRRALLKKLKNRNRSVQRSDGATFNGLALVAPWLSPFLPFGIVLGVIAKQQIRRSRIARGQQEQRGEWVANLAIGLSLFFVVVLIVALLCVGAIDTPEWDEFVWG